MTAIPLRLNGQETFALDPSEILLDWIRREGDCTGVKEGCAEGDCGACSVLMSPPEGGQFRPVNSCLLVTGQAAGHEIITVEGLGSRLRPHRLQAEIAATGGSQCGFCTPGFVIAGAALLDRNSNPSQDRHSRCAGRQSVSLHRLPADRLRHPGRGASHRIPPGSPSCAQQRESGRNAASSIDP